jgi:DNA-directed RNA polymerase sigma subunit (sigma70/sigma32)
MATPREDRAGRVELLRSMRAELLKDLPEEAAIEFLIQFASGHLGQLTLQECGVILGMSHQAANRWEDSALRKLQTPELRRILRECA